MIFPIIGIFRGENVSFREVRFLLQTFLLAFLMLKFTSLAKIIPSEGAHVQQTAFEGGIFFA